MYKPERIIKSLTTVYVRYFAAWKFPRSRNFLAYRQFFGTPLAISRGGKSFSRDYPTSGEITGHAAVSRTTKISPTFPTSLE